MKDANTIHEEWLKKDLKLLKIYKWVLISAIPFNVIAIIVGFVWWDNIGRLAVFCVGVCLASLPYHIRDLRKTLRDINTNENEIERLAFERTVAKLERDPEYQKISNINPRTGKPYKTSKAHRDAMKRYQAKRKAEMK